MELVIQALADQIWANPAFRHALSLLRTRWIQQELGLSVSEYSESDVVRCVQAAAVLAMSGDAEKMKAAYSIAACAQDLWSETLPGLSGALRLVLTRMGNFPALRTRDEVLEFSRLPMLVALEESQRARLNTVSVGDVELLLSDFQKKMWSILSAGKNVAVSAPTSAGKSFVLQAYLHNLFLVGKLKVACYIVPSRSLIAQVSDSINEWATSPANTGALSVKVLPVDAALELPSCAVWVLTQERVQAIAEAHPTFAPCLIICDEVQGLQDGSRGVLLQNVVEELLRRNRKAQVVLAGPSIRDLTFLAGTFGLNRLETVYSHAPATVQNLIKVDTRSVIHGHVSVQLRTLFNTWQDAGTVNISAIVPTVAERLVHVFYAFGRKRPSLVYANAPAAAEDIAAGISELSGEQHSSERLRELAALVRLVVHPKYALASLLERGIGFHYGRIPALIRRGVEQSFSDGDITCLVTTSTLMQGVNFPAANLFVCKPKKGTSKPVDGIDFWNLAGRAGRLGKEFQGNVFLIDYDEWQSSPLDESASTEVQGFIESSLRDRLETVIECARQYDPAFETDNARDIESVFSSLLQDFLHGRIDKTLKRSGIQGSDKKRIKQALREASDCIRLPNSIVASAPTVSPLRQQRLLSYLEKELIGGGTKRLEKIMPRHPRDEYAFRNLCEIYRICHICLMSLNAPKLHVRMAAISVKWMRGEPLPAIIDESRKYAKSSESFSTTIRTALADIEQEIRFKYVRLVSCYVEVLKHALVLTGNDNYVESVISLQSFLEVGASDKTMISLVGLGLSRPTARSLSLLTVKKEMDEVQAMRWLSRQDVAELPHAMQEDVRRVVTNAG